MHTRIIRRTYSTAPSPLASKHVLVTGGSRGIGLAIAKRLAGLGGSCIRIARDQTRLSVAVAQLPTPESQEHIFLSGDVPSAEFWAQVRQSKKHNDVLVNAAGITHSSLLVAMPADIVEDVVGTNLVGTVLACPAIGRGMVRRRAGCIINISILFSHPIVGTSVYSASKAGVLGLTRSLAVELGPSNIRVNAIVPGYIATNMTESLDPARKDAILRSTPLRRFGWKTWRTPRSSSFP